MSRKHKKQRIKIATAEETERFSPSGTQVNAPPADDEKDGANTTGPGSDAAVTQAGPDAARNEVESLRKELEEVKDKLLRVRAEQQNLMKRSANELSEAVRYANASLIKDLLGTIDDFERTLDHSSSADTETVLKGVRLIYENFTRTLESRSVEGIDALDKPFDPRFHEAMLQQPAPDKEPGTVIQVLQRGYKLRDRVLRPAKVIVAGAPEAGDAQSSSAKSDQAGGVQAT